jgi:thiamine kinase-like enzyme
VDPAVIVAQIWPGRQASVEPLGGGITNHNFKVTLDDGVYVLRIGGKDTNFLGIDRVAEYQATLAATAVGVGPEVVDFVEPEGYLVTRFIEGVPVPVEEMRRPENVRRTAEALRRFHGGREIPGRFNAFRVVEVYRDTAERHGVRIPEAYGWAHERATAIESGRRSSPVRPCHNDLLNANFIDAGNELRIVDWEYAGMGDVFFDLANFSINHELGSSEDEFLLEAYFGRVERRDLASLGLMRFMSDFREAMWGVVQQGISELEFDFVGYAREHFERLEETAGRPEFDEALEAARGSA